MVTEFGYLPHAVTSGEIRTILHLRSGTFDPEKKILKLIREVYTNYIL